MQSSEERHSIRSDSIVATDPYPPYCELPSATGLMVGLEVGASDGAADGSTEGISEGAEDGKDEGAAEGMAEGAAVASGIPPLCAAVSPSTSQSLESRFVSAQV